MSRPSRPRRSNSAATALRRATSSSAAKCRDITIGSSGLPHGHGGNAVVAAVEHFALTPDPVAVGSSIPEAVEVDRREVLTGVVLRYPVGQPASHRRRARDAQSRAPGGGEEALYLRHRADQVRTVGSEGRQSSLVVGDLQFLEYWKDGSQPLARLLHDLYRFLDVRRPGQLFEVVAPRIGLEEPVEIPALLGPQVTARVGHADHRMMVRDARNRGRGDPLVAYGDHRRLVVHHLRDDPRPGAGRHQDPLRLDETLLGLHPHHPAVPQRDPGRGGIRPDPRSQVLGGGAEGPRALPGVEVAVTGDEVPTLDAPGLQVRRQPGHLRIVHEVGLHAAFVRVLDVLLEGGHPFGREGQEEAADLAEAGVVAGLSLEAREQVYGVPDRPSHEGGGPDLADQPGRLGSRLAEQSAVTLQDLHVRPPGSRQVVGGAQAPDAAPDDPVLARWAISTPSAARAAYRLCRLSFSDCAMNSRSSSVMLRGGARVSTLLKPTTVSPFLLMMRPRSLQPEIAASTISLLAGLLLSLSSTSSIPNRSPLLRMSPTLGCPSSSESSVRSRSPKVPEPSGRLSSSMISRFLTARAQAAGLPPNVFTWRSRSYSSVPANFS